MREILAVLAAFFVMTISSAATSQPALRARLLIPYELFEDREAARKFIRDGGYADVLITDGRSYIAARGPYSSFAEALHGKNLLSQSLRETGRCQRLEAIRATPHGYLFAGDLPSQSGYGRSPAYGSSSKYVQNSDYKNIPLYFSDQIKVFVDFACPKSAVDRSFIQVDDNVDMSRHFLDPSSFLKDGAWFRISETSEFDLGGTLKMRNLETVHNKKYWSTVRSYIFSCPISGDDYVITDSTKYYDGSFGTGQLLHSSTALVIETMPAGPRVDALNLFCRKMAKEEKFVEGRNFSSLIANQRARDIREREELLEQLARSDRLLEAERRREARATPVRSSVADSSFDYAANIRCPDRPNVSERFYFSADSDLAARSYIEDRATADTARRGRGCYVENLERR